jgi:hypothetical protein
MSSLSSGNILLASDKSDKSIKLKDATSEKSSSWTTFDPLDDKSAATISKKGPMPPTAAVRSMFGVRAKKVAIKKEVLQSAAEAIVICIE